MSVWRPGVLPARDTVGPADQPGGGLRDFGSGISIEVAPDALVVPGEGIVRAISQVSRKRFGTIKVYFDVTLIVIAVVLSLVFFGELNGIGVGTVVSALTVGKFVNIIDRHFPLLDYIRSLKEQPELKVDTNDVQATEG